MESRCEEIPITTFRCGQSRNSRCINAGLNKVQNALFKTSSVGFNLSVCIPLHVG